MRLDNFISKSLLSIAKGINDSNFEYKEPAFKLLGGKNGTIDFEIQVTVEDSETETTGVGAKLSVIKVFSLTGNMKQKTMQRDLNLHSIRFSVKPAERYFFTRRKVNNE